MHIHVQIFLYSIDIYLPSLACIFSCTFFFLFLCHVAPSCLPIHAHYLNVMSSSPALIAVFSFPTNPMFRPSCPISAFFIRSCIYSITPLLPPPLLSQPSCSFLRFFMYPHFPPSIICPFLFLLGCRASRVTRV